MGLDKSAPEIEFALGAVRQAAQLGAQVQSEMATGNLTKSDLSPVTVADFGIQALVARGLAEGFPGDPLVAEETSKDLRTDEGRRVLETATEFVGRVVPGATAGDVCEWIDLGTGEPGERFWVLDPIDGTKGYLRGGQYAVALALIVDGTVQLGVLGCPNLGAGCVPDSNGAGVLVVAVRGEGAWETPLNEASGFGPLRVSECADVARARVLRSFEAKHTNTAQFDSLIEAMGVSLEPVLMDSQAKYALLAAGEGELLFRLLSPDMPDYREKIWDQAAGSIIVEEAGGRITDLAGNDLDFTQGRKLARNRGVLASNGPLHAAALEAIAGLEED